MNTTKTYFAALLIFVALIPSASAQWVNIPTGTTTKYESMYFFDAMNGVAASNGKVLRTSNGGDNWSIVNVSGVRDIDFADTNVGYIAGVTGSAIKKTTNGGLNWTPLTPIISNSLWGVSVVDANTVYVSGTDQVVWKSTNGGLSFTAVNLPSAADLVVDIDFASATTGVALDQSGVWKTTNGGVSWVNTFLLQSVGFTSIYFIDAMNGFAVGSAGTIIKTTDGGSSWVALNSGSSSYLQYVHFFDLNNGITVGYTSTVLRTTNGGQTWFPENVGITADFFSCILLSPTVALVGGDNGLIIKNQNLGTSVGQVNIAPITLEIYPNPSTGLFSVVSEAPILHLQVFNTWGALVHETAGTGFVTGVDLSENAPGVYFVKAETRAGVHSFRLMRE